MQSPAARAARGEEETGESEDRRPSEVVLRVPNTAEDDESEVDSFEEMWLNRSSSGSTLLQFYTDYDMAFRQLGHGEQAMHAAIFQARHLLSPDDDEVPTRLSTPLSVLESVYPIGGIVGAYDPAAGTEGWALSRRRRVAVPGTVLVVCAPSSSDRLKRLTRWRGVLAYAVLSSEPEALAPLADGKDPSGEYESVTYREPRSLVEVVRRLSRSRALFPLVRLGSTATEEDVAALLEERAWTLDKYGLYVHRRDERSPSEK
jgi:hypothetical protein